LSEKQYRTVVGIIQFDPKDQEAAGKQVRNVVVQQAGFAGQAVRTYLTVWPSHAHVKLRKDDMVIAEGSYSQGKSKDGENTYHNISVTRIGVIGAADPGRRADTVNDSDDSDVADDDDIPF